MRFNQTLEQQVQAEQGVVEPTAAQGIAQGLGTAVQGLTNFLDVSAENEKERTAKNIDARVEQLLQLEQDLVRDGSSKVKARQKIEEEIRNSFPDQPDLSLRLRGRLSAFRGGFVGQQIRNDFVSEQEQRSRTADELYSMIPPEAIAFYLGDRAADGVIDTEDKFAVYEQFQDQVRKAQAANAAKEAIIAEKGEVNTRHVNDFYRAALDARDKPLAQAADSFFGTIQSIDLNSPEGSVQFQNAKGVALQALAIVEQQVRQEYSEVIGKINDADTIRLAEKKRDAALDPILTLRTQVESDELDVLKQRANLFKGLVQDQQMGFAAGIGSMKALEGVYGAESMSVFTQRAVLEDPAILSMVTDEITGLFTSTNLVKQVQETDKTGVYTSPEQFDALYKLGTEPARQQVGLSNPKTTDRLAKEFVKAANFGGAGGLAQEDLQQIESDYTEFSEYWELLPEPEQEIVQQAYNKVRFNVMFDRTDGLVRKARVNGTAEFNAERGEFVVGEGDGPLSKMRGSNFLPGMEGNDPRGVAKAREKEKRQVTQELNLRLRDIVQSLKEENPDWTDQRVYEVLGLVQ